LACSAAVRGRRVLAATVEGGRKEGNGGEELSWREGEREGRDFLCNNNGSMSLGGRLCLSSSQGTNLTVTELNRLHGGLLNFGGGGGRRRRRQLNSFSSSNSNRSSFWGDGIGDHQCSSGGLNFLFHLLGFCVFLVSTLVIVILWKTHYIWGGE